MPSPFALALAAVIIVVVVLVVVLFIARPWSGSDVSFGGVCDAVNKCSGGYTCDNGICKVAIDGRCVVTTDCAQPASCVNNVCINITTSAIDMTSHLDRTLILKNNSEIVSKSPLGIEKPIRSNTKLNSIFSYEGILYGIGSGTLVYCTNYSNITTSYNWKEIPNAPKGINYYSISPDGSLLWLQTMSIGYLFKDTLDNMVITESISANTARVYYDIGDYFIIDYRKRNATNSINKTVVDDVYNVVYRRDGTAELFPSNTKVRLIDGELIELK